jgi:hypothetical protein
MTFELEDDEYALVLKPYFVEEDDEMRVSVGMAVDYENGHSVATQSHMYFSLTLLGACFDMLNKDEDFYEKVLKRRDEMFTEEEEAFVNAPDEDGIKPVTKYKTEGNVITLTQFSKTKGNA